MKLCEKLEDKYDKIRISKLDENKINQLKTMAEDLSIMKRMCRQVEHTCPLEVCKIIGKVYDITENRE